MIWLIDGVVPLNPELDLTGNRDHDGPCPGCRDTSTNMVDGMIQYLLASPPTSAASPLFTLFGFHNAFGIDKSTCP